MKVRQLPYWQDGQRQMSKKFYAIFSDWSATLRRLPLYADRKASNELARKIDQMNSARASGDTMPPELVRYVETMPPAMRDKLAKWGILSMARAAAGKALADHVADWKGALLAKGNTARHAELVTSRATKAFDACGFKFWSDLSASKLQSHLADRRQDRQKPDKSVERGLSAQTFNFYLQAVKQFCRWMVRDGRATESPLTHLQGVNVKTDRRHDRRALSPEELRWLLDITGKAVTRFGMTGEARAMLYHLALESGLRAAELRSLTRASFYLEGDEPSVTIAAAYAKNRRQDTLPLRPETASLLDAHLAGKMPKALAFDVPKRTEVSRMFRADLTAARQAWLSGARTPEECGQREGSTFLAEQDESGRWADFHALRHSFITGLVTGGVNPKVAQTLARHSVITLTMDRYTHLYAGNLAAALDVLPDLSPQTYETAVATGTTGAPISANPGASRTNSKDRLSPSLSPEGGIQRSPAESGAINCSSVANTTVSDNHAVFSEKTPVLTAPGASDTMMSQPRRSGRAVECAGLENR